MNIDEVINGWTFEETIKTAENLMEAEKNMFTWDVIRHLRDFTELYREKLKEYEDFEEQGLLLRLPCKVGGTVYLINSRYTKCTKEDQEFNEYSCQGCEWLDCDSHKEYYIHTNKSVSLEWIVRYSRDFGKTVFLTKSEAEAKLKELRGGA